MMEIPLSKLEPNSFNPNVMTKEEFDVLCFDMKTTGPKHAVAIAPIVVSPKTVFYNDPDAESDMYVIVDGEHRFKAANILGWETIPCEIHNIGEDLARVLNYRRNKERGHPDPLKEAALFKWEVDRGRSHEQIARAYMVDRTTATKRLALLNITEETWKLLDKVPRGTIKVSHLEPLSTLKPELQKEATKQIVRGVEYGHTITVDSVDRIAKSVKREDQLRRKLKAAVKKAKFPNCPKCGGSPTRIHWEGLPWVRCENVHEWNLETGKEYRHSWQVEDETKPERRKFPKTVRSLTTVEEYRTSIEELIKKVVPQFSDILHITIRGIFRGASSDFNVDLGPNRIHFSYLINGEHRSVNMEPHDYRSGEKTKVYNVWPEPKSEEDIQEINDFLRSLKERTLYAAQKETKS